MFTRDAFSRFRIDIARTDEFDTTFRGQLGVIPRVMTTKASHADRGRA